MDGPITARSRSSAFSILTTLDGGVARGYASIPQVERAIAVHLCSRNATAWRNRPRLPSKACKLTAALAAKAYSAAGQAASALHSMAILQVHQTKVLKQMHEGSTDPGLMQELRTATDFNLRAKKVTARSLGKAMSTRPLASPAWDPGSSARMPQNAPPSAPSTLTPFRCTTTGTSIVPLESVAQRLEAWLTLPSLAHVHNSTRLRDSVCQATSQVQRRSRDVGGSPERPCLA